MAANSKGFVVAVSLGKRFVDRVWAASVRERAPAPAFLASASRRGVHTSSYDKNIDELVTPVAVPDNVIGTQPTKYWGPNPKTGVFGPTDSETGLADSDQLGTTNGSSVLDQKVWFRPLADVDKPAHT